MFMRCGHTAGSTVGPLQMGLTSFVNYTNLGVSAHENCLLLKKLRVIFNVTEVGNEIILNSLKHNGSYMYHLL
jgi:hypothetical protein